MITFHPPSARQHFPNKTGRLGGGGGGGGGGGVIRWWPPSTMWAGPLIFLWPSLRCLNDPIFRIWGYVLHVEHISCVITKYGQQERVIPSHFPIALPEVNTTRKLLSQSFDLFNILLSLVTFLIIVFSVAMFSPFFYSDYFYCSMCFVSVREIHTS